jgi:hypothetical protein
MKENSVVFADVVGETQQGVQVHSPLHSAVQFERVEVEVRTKTLRKKRREEGEEEKKRREEGRERRKNEKKSIDRYEQTTTERAERAERTEKERETSASCKTEVGELRNGLLLRSNSRTRHSR